MTRKITHLVARIKHGYQTELLRPSCCLAIWTLVVIGDTHRSMLRPCAMLQQSEPRDYVIATGKTHSVREFLEIAFKHAGFDIEWSGKEVNENGIDKSSGKILVKIDPQFIILPKSISL